jgi:hypothetical protein
VYPRTNLYFQWRQFVAGEIFALQRFRRCSVAQNFLQQALLLPHCEPGPMMPFAQRPTRPNFSRQIPD